MKTQIGTTLTPPTSRPTGGVRRSGALLAAISFAAGALVAATPTSASAAEAAPPGCGSGYHCWYAGQDYKGNKWQVAKSNPNLSGYGIFTESGYNNGTSGQQNCGYVGRDYKGGTSTKTYKGTGHNYSKRVVQSNKWMTQGAGCS